jgi:transposase
MSGSVLGIDVGKTRCEASLRQQRKVYHRSFSNQEQGFGELQHWLEKHKVEQMHVCMEATGRYWEALAEYLFDQGYQVSVVNPARIRDYARSKLVRNKTDKLDADLIADFCASQIPEAWQPPAAEVRELQALVRYLDALQIMRTQESNRVQAGETSETVQQSLQAHLAFLDQQITDVEDHIHAHIRQDATLKQQSELLTSIAGIGPKTAAKLLSENIQRFTSTRAAVAYAGLNPQLHESGSSVRGRPHLSKIGNARLRKALYLPAVVAMRHNPIIRDLCQRLESRGKPKMVQVGAAMRKLLCLAVGVLKSGLPFDPQFSQLIQVAS